MTTLISIVVAFFVSVTLSRYICNPASRLHVLDHPNERSLHVYPVPRTGGVAILTGMFLGFAILCIGQGCSKTLLILSLPTAVLATLSYLDDRYNLSVKIRLVGQLICVVFIVSNGLILPLITLPGMTWEWPFWFGVGVSIIFLMWMINLYNFMDGMDGIAGGMTVIGFSSFAILGYLSGHTLFFSTSLIIVAATFGFLIFNYPPARIFLGDTGSASLGLLAGGLSLWGTLENIFPLWIALLIFSPFIIDATVTLFKRLIRGEKIWEAHKSHYYQRLIEKGWGHKRTVSLEYGIMMICSLTAILMNSLSPSIQWIIFCLIIMMYLILGYYIDTLVNDKHGV